jgi:hypothetical protein
MDYRGPALLGVVWFNSFPLLSPSLSVSSTGDTLEDGEDKQLAGGGGGGGDGANAHCGPRGNPGAEKTNKKFCF